MQFLDKDHIAQEAAFHMACHNGCKADAEKARKRAEEAQSTGARICMEGLAIAYEEVAQRHLAYYQEKIEQLTGPESFQAQLEINACGILIQKHA
ncbi:hypothetical protein ACFOTA_06815 [Chitinophaga sp. GCM10012297]|uniref:Uncharacterized protein n=1 Tax=Chitinophaga chungangae TaxID=2821488 RepID=A0ABS3YB56_9BACT|nr:hypothetical protein [Chitinophaga chungangae]MBO9151910.1 hypothetical protein [Chitinophaga chungangae]